MHPLAREPGVVGWMLGDKPGDDRALPGRGRWAGNHTEKPTIATPDKPPPNPIAGGGKHHTVIVKLEVVFVPPPEKYYYH